MSSADERVARLTAALSSSITGWSFESVVSALQALRGIAWKRQLRLSARFAQLRARGVQINKVCVAVARELAGFVWAIALAQARLPQT